jgi:beta-lactam-binding protein with PASTA domain
MKQALSRVLLFLGTGALALTFASPSVLAFQTQSTQVAKPPQRVVTQPPAKPTRPVPVEQTPVQRPVEQPPVQRPSEQATVQRPDPTRVQLPRCVVPNVIGDDARYVMKRLASENLGVGSTSQREDCRRAGTVVDQSPQARSKVICGSRVNITVAVACDVGRTRDGDGGGDDVRVATCPVPNLVGDELDDASGVLAGRKLALGRVQYTESDRKTGTILDQSPKPRAEVTCGSQVAVLVARRAEIPPPPVDCFVPDVLRYREQDLRKVLGAEKLQVGNVSYRESDATAGTVIDQSPKPRTRVTCGAQVDVLVATQRPVRNPDPPPTCVVPDVLRYREQDLRQALGAERLLVGKVYYREADTSPGTVLDQAPKPRTVVKCGSQVDVMLSTEPACRTRTVPQLVGRDDRSAYDLIKRAGLRIGAANKRESDQPAGTIVGQSPSPNDSVPCDAAIDVWIAVPVALTRVPLLEGSDADAAIRKLKDAGLRLGATAQRESTQTAGTVVDQSPAAGTSARPGDAVNVWMAVPPPLVMPNLRGRDRVAANEILRSVGLLVSDVSERQSEAASGTVVEQSPAAGTTVKPGNPVRIWLAIPILVEVPNLVGRGARDAAGILQDNRLRNGAVQTRESTEPRGVVLEQAPRAGDRVPAGTAVAVWVAAPIPPVRVPQLTGHDRAQAANLIRNAGLTPGRATERESDRPSGTVIDQSPAAGQEVERGSTVDLVLGTLRRPVLISVPDLTGRRPEDAANLLRGRQLRLGARATRESNETSGVIVDQRPRAGEQVNPGAAIDLWLAIPMPPVQIAVPNLQGRDRTAAAEELTRLGLVVGNVGERESAERRGTVVAQEPAAGVAVGAGAPVAFWLAVPVPPVTAPPVTVPPVTVTVPDVGGRTAPEAVRLIAEGRLTLGNVGNTESSTSTPGTVIAQQPLPGQAVAPGTPVNLVMATAPADTSSIWPPPTWVYPWLLAGALLGLTIAGAGSLAKSRQQQRGPSSTELAPHVDHGIQVTVPDDDSVTDFEITLEGRPDQGVQSIEDEGGSNTGMAGDQVTSW